MTGMLGKLGSAVGAAALVADDFMGQVVIDVKELLGEHASAAAAAAAAAQGGTGSPPPPLALTWHALQPRQTARAATSQAKGGATGPKLGEIQLAVNLWAPGGLLRAGAQSGGQQQASLKPLLPPPLLLPPLSSCTVDADLPESMLAPLHEMHAYVNMNTHSPGHRCGLYLFEHALAGYRRRRRRCRRRAASACPPCPCALAWRCCCCCCCCCCC